MKKIALVFVKNKEKTGQGSAVVTPYLPHPLLHLGSYLKRKGVKVFIIDEQLCDGKKEINRIINEVDIIGFSVMTMQVTRAIELSDYIKKNYPEKKIIWGGVHPSLLPKQTLQDPSIDYICQREGEKTIYELAIGRPLKTIKNLGYKEKDQIILNKIREDFLDLDKEDIPDWDLLNLENYVRDFMVSGRKGGRCIAITVGRGCIFNCAFCVNTIMGRRWRKLSAKRVIKRIKELKEKYKITHFNINDDCFDIDWQRVEEMCNGLIKEKLGITWDVSVRAGKKWTDEKMELLSKAGCIAVSIGAESGSDRILKKIKKEVSTEDIIYMAKQCNKHNISLISSWMSGFPGETEEELKQTVNLLKKVIKICPSCSIHGPQPLKLYPGSELYFEAIKNGFKEPRSLREWAKKSSDGFLHHKYLPWIKNPKKLTSIEFYCMNANRFPRNTLHKFLIYFSRLRLKHNFYFFPFENPLTTWYVTKIINKK